MTSDTDGGAAVYAMSQGFTTYPPTSILTGNTKLTHIPLTKAESTTFYRDMHRLASIQSYQRDLSALLLDDLPTYIYAAGVAKGSIGTNPVFGGVAASGNEIGMQLIRAITVRNINIASPTTPVLTWAQTYGAAGWTNVFGSATAPVNLGQAGLGTGATNTQNRVLLAFNALVNTSVPPLVSEYRFHIQSIDYPVEAVTWEPLTNLAYVRLATPVIIQVNGQFYMRGDIQPSGTDATQLFGITFASGDYLTYET